jgi:hypothetical protein
MLQEERNRSQINNNGYFNLSMGQLVNLFENILKSKIRKLEKLNKSFIHNKYVFFLMKHVLKRVCSRITLIYIYINDYK